MNDAGYTFEDLIQYADRLKWLILVAVCVGVAIYGFAMKTRALEAFATSNLMSVLVPDVSRQRQRFKMGLVLVAMLAVVLAFAGPRWGVEWRDVQKRRLDLMICLDVSRSMWAEDAGMSRLSRAKDDIKRLLDQVAGGTVGLVTFAGRGQLTCPLTDDLNFYRLILDDVGMQSADMGGTNLAAAIETAVKGFEDAGNQNRAIILITDGEPTGGDAVEAARAAHEKGADVYCIGIGDAERGALIPVEKDGQKSFVMYEGEQLWSKMDPRQLEAVAQAGGGEYFPSKQVTPRQRTIEYVYSERIGPKVEKSLEQKLVREVKPRFHWPATLALALLLIEPLVSERRRVA